MPPPDEFGKRAAKWTGEHIVTICAVLIAAGSLLTTVNSLDRRVTSLETKDEAKTALLSEVRGDVKVLLSVVERLEKRTDDNSGPQRTR
jgi:hypothetical protein